MKLFEFPTRKVLDYVSLHGLPTKDGWRVTHHYVDGGEKDFEFPFSEADQLAKHLWDLTGGRIEKG